MTINSGGEKIFAEEVEAAVKTHTRCRTVWSTGRPSDRWGQRGDRRGVAARGSVGDPRRTREHAATHLARYKLPKATVFVDRVLRSPAGKADYRWAKEQALDTHAPTAPT